MTRSNHKPLATRYRGQSVGLACAICHAKFTKPASLADTIKTCSPGCRAIYHRIRGDKVRGMIHSPETRAKKRAFHEARRITVVCGCGCGTEFRIPPFRVTQPGKGRVFLNKKHYYAWAKGENSPTWRGGGTFRYGPGWNEIKKEVRARDRVCQHCGKTPEEAGMALDVHHVIPFRDSGDNSMSNLIAPCKPCHGRVKGERTVKRLPTFRRICVECGEFFTPPNFQRRTCSDECRRRRTNRASAECERRRRQRERRQHDLEPPAVDRAA